MADNRRGRSRLSLVEEHTEAGFYAGYLRPLKGPVLILGCGGGRVAGELSARGAHVVGVDPSSALIALGEERRVREDVEGSNRLKFVAADLRSLRLKERFPLVIAPQNCLGLMGSVEDLEALFATAKHHLVPAGTLLFDVLNANSASAIARGEQGRAFLPPSVAHRAGFVPHLRECRRSGLSRSASIRRLRLRQFHPDQVDSALRQAGFVALERFGGYDGKAFSSEDPLQIVVATLS
jgi:SAM-dependent methyltransferase